MNTELATTQTFTPLPLSELKEMAEQVAASKMFPGIRTPAQAFALMLICQAEGQNPVLALRRYHVISMGQGDNANTVITMRADYMQGAYEERGNLIVWHRRDDEECAATFIRDGAKLPPKEKAEAIKRAKERYKLQSKPKRTDAENDKLIDLGEPNEMLIIRTRADATAKKLDQTYKDGAWKPKFIWQQNPRQLLHARCLTEGVRATDPGLIAGIMGTEEAEDVREIESMNTLQAAGQLALDEHDSKAVAGTIETNPKGGTTEYIAPEKKEVRSTAPDWKDLVIPFGDPAKSQYYGKKLSELASGQLRWVCVDWRKLARKNKKEREFGAALDEAINSGALVIPEASPEPAKPETKPEPPPEDKKPVAVKSAPKNEPPMEWRSIEVHPKCAVQGKALYEILSGKEWTIKLKDSEGKMSDGKRNGVEMMRLLHKQLVPKLTEETKDRILKNAIEACCEETGALLEIEDLRKMLADKFTDEQLRAASMMEESETIAEADEDLLRLIARNQPSILAKIKEGK